MSHKALEWTPGLPLFTAAGLVVLDGMPFDPAARGRFEFLSGGLLWPDEFPLVGTPERAVLPAAAPGCLLAYRAAITLGVEASCYRPLWEQVARHAPNWPGLRPERRGGRARRRLRAGLRVQDKCLTELEARLDAGDPGTGGG